MSRIRVAVLLALFATAILSAGSLFGQSWFRPKDRPVLIPPQAPTVRANAHKFLGWKYAERAGEAYRQRFQRPRAGLAQPRVATNGLSVKPGAEGKSRGTNTGSQTFPGLALRPTLPAGFIPDCIATADFNGDGKADWVIANGGDNNLWVYLGNGDGTFSPPRILNLAGLSPTSVAVGDLRGNGKMDIVVSETDSNSVEVFLSNGDGTFQSTALIQFDEPVTFVTLADFNRDGHLDLVVALYGQSPIAFLPGTGDGGFGAPVFDTWGDGVYGDLLPVLVALSVGDFNGDGNLDLAYVDLWDGGGVGVVLAHGGGSFGPGTLIVRNVPLLLYYLTAAIGDVTGDGCPDLVTTDTFAFVDIYTGNCNGTFSSTPTVYGAGVVSVSLALQDVDGDGHPDIVVGGDLIEIQPGDGIQSGTLLSVLKADGDGGFGTAHVYRGHVAMYALGFVQLENSRVPSVIAVNEDSDSLTLFVNDGTGDFGAPRGLAMGYESGLANAPFGGFVAADVNGDHLLDLLNVDFPQLFPGTFKLSTMRNLGSGQFAPRVLSALETDSVGYPGDIAAGDFRNTGRQDVVVIGSEGGFPFVAFAANNGDGSFAAATVVTPQNAWGRIGVGDFNRDGKLDFVAVSGGFSTGQRARVVQTFLGNGNGTFNALPEMDWSDSLNRSPIQVYVGDFNADGKLDLLVHVYQPILPPSSNGLYVLYGNGDGTFRQPTELFHDFDPFTLIDLNHDGISDIVTCSLPGSSYPDPYTPARTQVLLGKSSGGFGAATVYQDLYAGSAAMPYFMLAEPGFHDGLCSVGDFNGDGNIDVAVMQQYAGGRPTYVQFLSGNSDGTFTPTYNIYSFGVIPLPQQWYNLNADGKTDLVELDGYTSSFHSIPGTTAQAFQLETVTEPILGNAGVAQISIDVPSSSDTVFTLQSSDPGLELPSTVTIPAGAITREFHYTVSQAADLHHVFKISAVLGSEREDTYNFVQTDHRVTTGFTLALSEPHGTVTAGGTSADFQPYYTALANYSTTIDSFSCSGLPAGLSCAFSPNSITLGPGDGFPGSLLIHANANVTPGAYIFQAVAGDSNGSTSAPGVINVYGAGGVPTNTVLTSATNPSQVGQQVTLTATVTAQNGSHPTGNVSFQIYGVPVGSAALNNSGVATLNYTFTSYGTIQLTAIYSGSATFAPSTSYVLMQVVNPFVSTTSLTSTPNPSIVGQPVTITATITPVNSPPASGTVSFTSSGQAIPGCATVPVSSSMAQCVATALVLGTNALAAHYSGDSYYTPSSATLTQYVNPVPTPLQFVAMTPCRVIDTRPPYGRGPIQGGSAPTFMLTGGDCGVPSSAAAFSLNVTALPHGPLRYLTIWPTDEGQPLVSTLNSPDGRVKANAAIVPAGTDGGVNIFVTDTSDVILDINGYFTAPGAETLQFYPLAPCRVSDTRDGNLPDGLGPPRFADNETRSLPVLTSSCLSGINNAKAYSMNVTAAPSGGAPVHYLTTWPSDQPQPTVSTLNDNTGTVVANAAIIPAGANGDVSVFVTNSTDVIVDINGYFAPPGQGGYSFYPTAPCRAFDSRNNNGQPFQGERTVNVVGSPCAPPSLAQAYVFNATVVPSGSLGFLTLWSDGQNQPVVSTLNARDGFTASNMGTVPTANGSIDAYTSGLTQLILDISGYFAP